MIQECINISRNTVRQNIQNKKTHKYHIRPTNIEHKPGLSERMYGWFSCFSKKSYLKIYEGTY